MLGKLLKNDMQKNMRWLWVLFVATIAFAGITRACTELGLNIAFFKVLGIFFQSVAYALIVNCLVQPFLRGFLNLTKSLYGDESYLTHTLPVSKNQIINSKFLTVLIELVLGFATLIVSLLIMFASNTLFPTIKLLLSTMIVGEFNLFWILTLFIILVVVEFLMFISIVYYSIVLAYKQKEKRVLKSFIYTAVFAFASLTVLSIAMVVVLLINNVNLTSTMLTLSSGAFLSIILTGIIVYSLVITLFYFLTKKEFNKGVNVD